MTLASVAVDEPVKASLENQFIGHLNNAQGRQLFTSNGTFTVPSYVHRVKVTLCGGGGPGGLTPDGDTGLFIHHSGGLSPMVSKVIAVEPGSSYTVTIGAGGIWPTGNGGTTSFGAVFNCTGGQAWENGAANGSSAGAEIRHAQNIYCGMDGTVYGMPSSEETSGVQGACLVEW